MAGFDKVMAARVKILAAAAGANQQIASAQDSANAYKSAVKAREKKIKKAWARYEAENNRVQQHNDLERSNYNSNPWFYTPDYWNYPDYPTDPEPIKVPSFESQSKKLRRLDSDLSEQGL